MPSDRTDRKPYPSLLLAYHHDYNCLSEQQLKLCSVQSDHQARLEKFEAVKQASIARFYK